MLETFIELLKCSSKNDLQKTCKSIEVASSDFVDFIMLCKSGHGPFEHAMHYHDFVPDHLETTEEDFDILNQSREIQQSKKGKKSFTRLFKTHGQRKYKIGHLFYEKNNGQEGKVWHFIFYEMSELKEINNHWVGGSHFHIVNYLWPNINIHKVWHDFIHNKEYPSTKLHVKYQKNA